MAGHLGFLKSYQRAKREFFWQGMKADLKAFVRECDVCQRIKFETSILAGLTFGDSYHSLDICKLGFS